MPSVIARFSTTRYRRGLSAFWISRAPLSASVSRVATKYWNRAYSPAMTNTMIAIDQSLKYQATSAPRPPMISRNSRMMNTVLRLFLAIALYMG